MSSATDESLRTSRRWVGRILGYALLLLLPLLLGLVGLGAKFPGLRTSLALEHADLGRRLAEGEGFTTGSLRPLSLALHSDARSHPDLYHAPLHPLVLATAFSIVPASDRVAAVVGLLLWTLTVVLTFFLARRWFGTGTAVVATAFYGCNVAMLRGALYGLPYPLAALCVLAVAWLAAPDPKREGEAEGEARPNRYRLGLAGAACALAALTHYGLFFLAPVVGIYLAISRRRRWRALSLFVVGFVAALIPWMAHNMARGFSPVFSLYWYEAMAGTETYPGDLVWRSMSAAAASPLGYMFFHPVEVVAKGFGGLARFWGESFAVTNPVVLFLFVGALAATVTTPRWRGWLISVLAGVLVCVIGSCVLRPEPELLMSWSPILSIAAGAFVVRWLSARLEDVSMRGLWERRPLRRLFGEPERLRGFFERAIAVGLVLAAAFPLLYFLGGAGPDSRQLTHVSDAVDLKRHLDEGGTVMTDRPAFIAWYAQRRTLWLFLDERDWDKLESRCGAIDATYVTSSVAALAPRETGIWWWWLASPRGSYRELVPVDPRLRHGTLRVRRRGEGG